MKDIEEKVYKIIAKELGISSSEIKTIKTKEALYCRYSIDSLDEIEIFMSIEEGFDIQIDDDEAESWRCIEDIVLTILKYDPNYYDDEPQLEYEA